jgi:L-rhamnose mutarotase
VSSERVRFIYRLKPGAGEEYDRAHTRVPEELLDLLAEAGISDYTIWRHEEILVCEFQSALGFENSHQLLSASDVQRRWTESLTHLFEKIDDNGQPLWLGQVFRFEGTPPQI